MYPVVEFLFYTHQIPVKLLLLIRIFDCVPVKEVLISFGKHLVQTQLYSTLLSANIEKTLGLLYFSVACFEQLSIVLNTSYLRQKPGFFNGNIIFKALSDI